MNKRDRNDQYPNSQHSDSNDSSYLFWISPVALAFLSWSHWHAMAPASEPSSACFVFHPTILIGTNLVPVVFHPSVGRSVCCRREIAPNSAHQHQRRRPHSGQLSEADWTMINMRAMTRPVWVCSTARKCLCVLRPALCYGSERSHHPDIGKWHVYTGDVIRKSDEPHNELA